MDLTPSNIIISSHDMLPKIIDFGEAYHSQLKKGKSKNNLDYYPGFTNPFGPPEVFSKKHYNTKQDMFSYGMNMFFMLFGNFPFQPTSLLKLSYKNNKYL